MNKSITKRLFFEIVFLILSFSLVLLVANSLLLKPLYYYSVEKSMEHGITALSELNYFSDDQSWVYDINTIDSGHSYDISIERNGKIIYSSSREVGIREPEGTFRVPPDAMKPQGREPLFPGDKVTSWREIASNIFMGTLDNPKDEARLFVVKTQLENGMVIYLTQGIAPVINSVNQANLLLITVTVVFLGIATLIALKMARNFTKPIKIIKQHVDQLSQLDFTNVLDIQTQDELQDLSMDINQLSEKLQQALTTLQQQNHQLEMDIKSQRKFISNASHELRTPLALIQGYAQEIAQGYVKDVGQQQVYVGYIAEESVKMKRLLNDILELSRLESGRMVFNAETLDVKQSIEAFIDKYTGFIEDHDLRMSIDLVAGLGLYDYVRFEQILANYLSNCGKYCDSRKMVRIRNQVNDKTIRIYVSNSGEPISQEVIDFIWDGFYKADEARTTKEGSYGLGLSIVKAIQDATGQAFGCFNEDGFVTFWFDVPKYQC